MTKTTTDVKTSKYFQSPVKEEETDNDDNIDTVISAAPVATVNDKKTENEEEGEDSEEEDDWEEVEGQWEISRKRVLPCFVR